MRDIRVLLPVNVYNACRNDHECFKETNAVYFEKQIKDFVEIMLNNKDIVHEIERDEYPEISNFLDFLDQSQINTPCIDKDDNETNYNWTKVFIDEDLYSLNFFDHRPIILISMMKLNM